MPSQNELNARARVVGLDPASYANDSKLEQKILYLEKNATAISGTLATGTLTQGGAATAGDQIEIDGVIYEFVTALTEAKATSTFTIDTNATEGSTVTVEGQTYTFTAYFSNVGDELRKAKGEVTSWRNLTVNFISKEPLV